MFAAADRQLVSWPVIICIRNLIQEYTYCNVKNGGEEKMLQKKSFLHSLLAGFVFTIVFFVASTFFSCIKNPASFDTNENELETVSPEDVGWSSEKLEEAKAYFNQIGSAAVMALYDGKVFIAWGEVTTKYWCHSIRKCFLSGLYGIHVENENIDLDKTLEELNIDDIPPSLTNEEKQATVCNLIKSRSGVYHEAAAEDQSMIDSRPERGSHAPGTFFYYNNWDFNVAGTIFEQETGTGIFEEFKDQIADQIGMQHFLVEDCYYQYENEKSMHPAYKFRMTAIDMARYGLLYQKNGKWRDNQIISPEWIAESTTLYSTIPVEIDSVTTVEYGYGCMWYILPEGLGLGHGGFFHTGIGVHLLAVFPEDKLVLVHRVNTDVEYSTTNEQMWQLVVKIFEARLSE